MNPEKECSKICECDMYLMEDANTCHFYKNVSDIKLYCGTETKPTDGIANYYGSDSTDVSANTDTNTSCPTSIKCVADNGTAVGEPLCCGQTGVVQDTKFNCPSEYPHCIGYKCGESWGKCSTTPSSQ